MRKAVSALAVLATTTGALLGVSASPAAAAPREYVFIDWFDYQSPCLRKAADYRTSDVGADCWADNSQGYYRWGLWTWSLGG
jgi:hypothetical protein